MSHTPGPWHAPGLAEVHDANNRCIALCFDCDPVPEDQRPVPNLIEGNANARLIAAAPDLLEALEWAMQTGLLTYTARISGQNETWCDAVDRAHAAIKKARGE